MFDHLNKVLYKTKTPDTTNVDDCTEFVPFMVQRWCSMHSPQIASLVNITSNRMWPILENKTMWFNYMHGVIPRSKFKRIAYIKKKKDIDTVKNKEIVQKVASNLELSSREVNEYIELFNLKLPNDKNTREI